MGQLALNSVGAVVVAFTLVVNLARGLPMVSLAAALLVAAGLHRTWVRAGRPGGIRDLAAEAEAEPAGTPEHVSDSGQTAQKQSES